MWGLGVPVHGDEDREVGGDEGGSVDLPAGSRGVHRVGAKLRLGPVGAVILALRGVEMLEEGLAKGPVQSGFIPVVAIKPVVVTEALARKLLIRIPN